MGDLVSGYAAVTVQPDWVGSPAAMAPGSIGDVRRSTAADGWMSIASLANDLQHWMRPLSAGRLFGYVHGIFMARRAFVAPPASTTAEVETMCFKNVHC